MCQDEIVEGLSIFQDSEHPRLLAYASVTQSSEYVLIWMINAL